MHFLVGTLCVAVGEFRRQECALTEEDRGFLAWLVKRALELDIISEKDRKSGRIPKKRVEIAQKLGFFFTLSWS